ncbi:hypothetical protein EV182_000759 [Spiromyces aspiralis]|uniref:Uncharacterized protein n=1 Tax=Spiromyces aspiralis TaxID=68401 RepID=A0ACC1HMX6_9FUNG|nr:hypothetical protein EV182_000759 [Spiromyces aspiralis]
MKLALTSPIGGYYTRGQAFGREGDFVTSPEISQMFTIGLGKASVFVELGPGKGTLMSDILRISRRFPDFAKSLSHVHLVETSPKLREVQAQKLGCSTTGLQFQQPTITATSQIYSVPVTWHHSIDEISLLEGKSESVYNAEMPLVMAHEFFDALPIYRFAKTARGWQEILVDIDESPEAPAPFRFVKSRQETTNTAALMKKHDVYDEGELVEISPESGAVMGSIAKLVDRGRGVGLVIDYGQDWSKGDTFRGIRKHKFANPLEAPGTMDLTADVDFSFLRRSADGLGKLYAKCFGPVEQGKFLHAMGIQYRLQQLVQSASDAKIRQDLIEAYKRLVGTHSMGSIYKVMSVVSRDYPPNLSPPVAFESAHERQEGTTKYTPAGPPTS